MNELFKKFRLNLWRFIPFTILIIGMALLMNLEDKLPNFLLALLLVFLGVFMFDLGAKEFSSKSPLNYPKHWWLRKV